MLISIISLNCLADSYYFAWDGVGVATKHNYNAAQSYGSYQYKGVANGLGTGGMEIYQQFNINYDQESTNRVGTSVRYNLLYRFVSPMVVVQLAKSGQTQFYMTAGVGDLQSGTATVHKWSHVPAQVGDNYDNVIDKSGDVNGYAIRLGFGFTQFYPLGGNFHLFLNEDVGWIATPLVDVTDPDYSGMKANVSHLFQPTVVSFRIGIAFITHSRNNKTPYKIYFKEEF
jgi:hypothetical protein